MNSPSTARAARGSSASLGELKQGSAVQVALAQVISGTEQLLSKPYECVPLDIPCTGKNCNPKDTYVWTCTKCMKVFYFGFDKHVYCDCGKTPVNSLEFKCTDPKHGKAFESHDPNLLTKLVNALQPFNEMNILILGETGVGKSTWINGFVNFLSFESLEEAEKGELCTLIPSEFTVYDEDFKKILVKTGTDKNEVCQTGQSATQDTKVYPFKVGNTTIRLIDTPGIGDTRGIEKDLENFQNILGTLSNLEELHGICILLKPNNARLTVMFRFCIKELLTNLHRDASKNIVFCFTNSRGTFYRPGETMPALQALLTENKDVEIPVDRNTVYCYDSEAYRFLAAVKNDPPVKFADDDKENFANSWKKSIAETARMLKYIKGLEAHNIKSTISLNNTRQLVLNLARPLAETNRLIQVNKSIVEDEIREIESIRKNIKELEKKKITTRMCIVSKPINHPKTVCSNIKCANVATVNNVATTLEYKTVCHPICQIQGVSRDVIGHPGLMNCWAFTNDTCRICDHKYTEHVHVYYDSVQEPREQEDMTVKNALNEKLSFQQTKEKMIEAKNKEVKEYEHEQDKIVQASANFAYFLKSNAITPYNDAIEQYLDHLIREEKDKLAITGNSAPLEHLKKSKDSYNEQKKILEKEMDKGVSGDRLPPGPAEVKALVEELKTLKHSGKVLKDALQCVEHTNTFVYQETIVNQSSSMANKIAIKIKVGLEVFGSVFRNF